MFGSMIAHYQAYILQQEDIRNHIDSSVKRGYDLSTFRKERIGGDSLGISYWWVKKFHHFLVEKYPEKFHGSDVTVHANQVM
jgi:hypothetical protein